MHDTENLVKTLNWCPHISKYSVCSLYITISSPPNQQFWNYTWCDTNPFFPLRRKGAAVEITGTSPLVPLLEGYESSCRQLILYNRSALISWTPRILGRNSESIKIKSCFGHHEAASHHAEQPGNVECSNDSALIMRCTNLILVVIWLPKSKKCILGAIETFDLRLCSRRLAFYCGNLRCLPCS